MIVFREFFQYEMRPQLATISGTKESSDVCDEKDAFQYSEDFSGRWVNSVMLSVVVFVA